MADRYDKGDGNKEQTKDTGKAEPDKTKPDDSKPGGGK